MKFRRTRDDEPELNLIPLIDVMLVVLIFLAVTTSYSRFAELQIELPTASARPVPDRNNEVVVGVSADGRYALDRQQLARADIETLAAALRQSAQNRSDVLVVIHADAQAPHQSVINVLEAARIAQLPRISFVTAQNDRATH
jgi:biopolymer transport protein ExbD